MSRLLLTIAIAFGLYAAQQLYVRCVTPWIQVVERPQRPPEPERQFEQPPEVQALTDQHLHDENWTKTAAIRWQRSETAYLFAETVKPIENERGDTIRMAPFAMIISDPKNPSAAPLTVVAAAARVRFENQFFDPRISDEESIDLLGGDMGRLMGASLEGQVRITGPDGLVIDGQDFTFQEDSAQLYSDHPIFFRYGPSADSEATVRGGSEGVTIDFQPASSSPFGGDMPRVEEMPRSLQLRSRVVMDFTTVEKGESTRTRVTSQGPFTFDFQQRLGRFVDEVHVVRPNPDNELDEIACHELRLQFGDEAAIPSAAERSGIVPASASSDSANEPSFLKAMPLLEVRARARYTRQGVAQDKVIVRSTLNGLRAELDDLLLAVPDRMITLTDAVRVAITREIGGDTQTFLAPQIQIEQAADQTLERITATGAGEFRHFGAITPGAITARRPDGSSPPEDNAAPPALWATWSEQLVLQPLPTDHLTQLTIRGDVIVRQADQMQVSAQSVTAWTDEIRQLAPGQAGSPRSRASRKSSAQATSPFPLRRVLATEAVSFVTAHVVGRKIQSADIRFDTGAVAVDSQPSSSSRRENEPQDENPRLPFVFECGRLTGVVVNDSTSKQMAVRELKGFDGVRVTRELPPELGGVRDVPFDQLPVRLTAREFTATNADGTKQVLTLRGVVDDEGQLVEPVDAHIGDFSLSGPVLVLDREQNLATLIGESVLGFPVDRDFSGNPLTEPSIAHIACVEQIEFDGQRAEFLQSVKATVQDNIIRAEALTANLSRRIDFSAARPDTRNIQIATIQCRDKVSLEMYQYDLSKKLQEILVAQMHRIDINQTTGQFDGVGPGVIKDWRRAGTRRMGVQPKATANSNRPTSTNRDYPWEFVGITFRGAAEGNLNERWSTLNDRVEVIYAPVKNAMELFHRSQLSSEDENATEAVYIRCDQLRVALEGGERTAPEKARDSLMVTVDAFGRAEMEAQKFYARAHLLKYQQANEMFTLSGKGQEKASLSLQDQSGGSEEPFRALVIQYAPARQNLTIDGAQTFIGVSR